MICFQYKQENYQDMTIIKVTNQTVSSLRFPEQKVREENISKVPE